MGRPPSMDPARRNSRVGPQELPAHGRQGRAPAWPLPGRKRSGEQDAWRDMWHTPQAVAWERLGWTRTVARYCRVLVAAERELDTQLLAEARQLEDRLGLTPKAMRLMLWTIVGDTLAEARARKAEEAAQAASSQGREAAVRQRVRVVADD